MENPVMDQAFPPKTKVFHIYVYPTIALLHISGYTGSITFLAPKYVKSAW